MSIEYHNGHIYDNIEGELTPRGQIFKVGVQLEQKPNEIGIYRIIGCILYGENDIELYQDTEILCSKEYNDADGSAFNEIKGDLSRRYTVSSECIIEE